MADIIIQSFNAGELTPKVDGRSDLEKYYFGAREYVNMIPLPYGPAERRPGTYFVAELKDNSKKAKLQSFQYSTEQAYILEFGDEYIRFFMDRGQIVEGLGTEDISSLDNIVAHWLLNEDEGTTVVDDEVGHNGVATVDCDILHADGKVGTGCFDLDGQYTVEIGVGANEFSFTDDTNDSPFSIACWAYVTEQSGAQVLLSKWQGILSLDSEWLFCLNESRKLELRLNGLMGGFFISMVNSRIAHWKLNDDLADNDVLDDDPTAHNGLTQTSNTNVLTRTGKVGKCLKFGGSDCVVITNDHDELSFVTAGSDDPFGIAAWIYVTPHTRGQTIISKYDYTSGLEAREWRLRLSSRGALGLRLFDEDNDGHVGRATSEPLTTGWHFVVATYDGTGGATAYTGITLYVDDEAVSMVDGASGTYADMVNTATKVVIGAVENADGDYDYFFRDKIDNIVLFDKELSAAGVSALWNGGDGTEDLPADLSSPYVTSDNVVPPGWHHFVATYSAPADPTKAADGMILYIDSVAVESIATNEESYFAMQIGLMEIRIGSQRNAADDGNEKFWGDKIDEISVYSDVLTPGEVLNLYSISGLVPYEIESDYLEADLFGLQHAQSADVLFNVHGNYPPSKLMRYAHNTWALEDIDFDWPPFLDVNITDTTITPSDTVGVIDLTASTPIFTSDHIGSYWLIKHPRTDNKIEHNFGAAVGYSPILVDVRGSWRLRTSGTWTGKIEIQATYDEQLVLVLDDAPALGAWSAGDIITGAAGETCIIVSATDSTHYVIKQLSGSFTDDEVLSNQSANSRNCAATWPRYEGWHTVEPFQSVDDQNFNVPGEEEGGDAYYRVECTAADDAALNITLSCQRYYHYGIVKITGFMSATSVSATVIRTLGSTSATKLWSEGAWSDERGHPVTTAFFEGRLFYAGTPYRPLNIWGSRIQDYENMDVGDKLDDDAVKFTVDASMQNIIRWLVSHEVLLIGTSSGEWRLGSVDPADAITPTNPMRPKEQTTYGSKEIQAILLANAVLFVDAQGRRVRGAQYIFEKGELGGYDAPDYTMLSEHITESGIIGMAYQQNPYPILWCVRDDGVLIGMVFEPGQKVWGWFRCVIDGDVESVAVIRGVAEDEVWIIVKREINGNTKRYVEYFKPRDWGDDQADCFFVDSGLSFDGGDAVTITGITRANPGVVTVGTWPVDGNGDNIADGDQIRIRDVVGMLEVNNKVFSVSNPNVEAKTFELRDNLDTINFNTSAYTAYVSGGTVQKVDNTFGGLGHLEAETVSVLGDGSVHADVVVSSAIVTLTDYFNKCHIGKGFKSSLKPMKLAVPGANIQGKVKRIHEIIFSFYKTLGAKFGPTSGDDTIPFRRTIDPMGYAPPLFTGEKEQTFSGGYELEGNIYIEQTQPLPMTVRSITAKLQIYGD